jgi:hypothetical protein
MKKNCWLSLVLLAILLAACASGGNKTSQGSGDQLKVSDGTKTKIYAVSDLKKLPVTQADFKGVTYQGVTIKALLADAGFTPDTLKAVKAVAQDGFTANYDPSTLMRDDMIVAYATKDGAMTAEDGSFRIVLPGGEGKMNPRVLIEVQAVP